MLADPRVIILDEAVSSVDPARQKIVWPPFAVCWKPQAVVRRALARLVETSTVFVRRTGGSSSPVHRWNFSP